jgi:hypothetical protein
MNIGKNRRKSPKIAENRRKSPKIAENRRKSPKIGENRQKSPKIILTYNIDPWPQFDKKYFVP